MLPRSNALADAAFRNLTRLAAFAVFSLLAAILVSLAIGAWPSVKAFGVEFLWTEEWDPVQEKFGALVPIVGTLVTAVGAVALASGLFGNGDNALPMVGLGAVVVFFGVAILGPSIAAPLSAVIGAPIRRFKGITGSLARENAMRNPKRTSATASSRSQRSSRTQRCTVASSRSSRSRLPRGIWLSSASPPRTRTGCRPSLRAAAAVMRSMFD